MVRFTVYSYTALAPFGWALFGGLAFLWRRDPRARIRRMQRLTLASYRFMHDWLNLVGIARFDHRRRPSELPAGPYVAIANHPTAMDITALFALLGGGCTIVKQQVFRRRLLRGLLASAGHLEAPAGDIVSIGRSVDGAVERLRQGFSVVVFPEGTRSPDHGLLPFGRFPFEIARRAGVPLISIAIECEPLWISKGVPLFRIPDPTPVLRLSILAIDPPETFEKDSKDLLRRVEARYRSWLASRSPLRGPAHDSRWEMHPCQSS